MKVTSSASAASITKPLTTLSLPTVYMRIVWPLSLASIRSSYFPLWMKRSASARSWPLMAAFSLLRMYMPVRERMTGERLTLSLPVSMSGILPIRRNMAGEM